MTDAGWSEDGCEFSARWSQPVHGDRPDASEHKAAIEAWEIECVRIRNASGLPLLERRRDFAYRRLIDATEALTAVPATSIAGLAAKARAWLAIDGAGNEDDWTESLVRSLVTDVLAIGGLADA